MVGFRIAEWRPGRTSENHREVVGDRNGMNDARSSTKERDPRTTRRDFLSSPVLLEFTNPRMKRAVKTARNAAASSAPVLLTGEQGSGRSVLAAAIHGLSSR